eukprot:TRINITY_DN9087_c0_g1_i14.p1 TRINITY_DN9087_c0_g1~~TRINITY_DN9087_c0_g1_i14.p1  ORF type:complete len:132 (+),score=7.23 TRINITY_DN9087_c0_g1_i14:1640-2035(+)
MQTQVQMHIFGITQDRQMGRILATGSRNGDLYALDGNMAAALVAIKSGKAPQDIWHERLGHLHSRLLKVSSSNNGFRRWVKVKHNFQRRQGCFSVMVEASFSLIYVEHLSQCGILRSISCPGTPNRMSLFN